MKLLAVLFCCGLVCCSSSPEASAAGDVSEVSSNALDRTIAQSDVLASAQAAIDSGHPWIATELVTPVLRDAKRRTPAALIVAARAAAGWNGWTEVDSMLSREPWLDTQFDGEGRELLAQSALERGVDTAALSQSSAAFRDAKTATARATRLVYLGRALERNNMFDSAAAVYARAGASLRPIRDWLNLRAAGAESDSTKRAALFAAIRSPTARARIDWTDAQARERFSDAAGAAARYAKLGATVSALRLRLSLAPDSARRDAIKAELLTFIRTHSGSADAKSAVDVLDKGFSSLSRDDELIVARSAAASGPVARAITAFGRAQPTSLTANDQLQYALALSRAGQTKDALARFAAVTGPLAGQAAYQRARVLQASSTDAAAQAALRSVVSDFPSDTAVASAALFLLADLSTDAGKDSDARTLYQQLYRSYPTASRAADARFNAAIISLIDDNAKRAASELDSLVAVLPASDEANGARYWSGRAWKSAGNTTLAESRWRGAIAAQPTSYYALMAARRLSENPWRPAANAADFSRVPSVDSAIARAALLEQLGMDTEARFEYDALESAAPASADLLGATAQAFLAHGQSSRAVHLAQKLVDLGQRDARTYRLLYPLVDRAELETAAKTHDLDPALVAGLIRQESNFNPHAVSVANARGLMQVLPAVGREAAQTMKFPIWDSALLTDPDANLQLGTAHLAAYTKQYGPLPRVLAAYNAGGSRVTRWATKAGMDDPELFTERIPFDETRDYVRIVQRNAEIYRALYW
ncbi:MAG TPA: transglycosylase SLT domain-containing protein [Gemmatimonadaceae bacterium]|jgi:soluble lytic murein transglycosylase